MTEKIKLNAKKGKGYKVVHWKAVKIMCPQWNDDECKLFAEEYNKEWVAFKNKIIKEDNDIIINGTGKDFPKGIMNND